MVEARAVLVLACVAAASAFNLDVRVPVLKRGSGLADGLFGYAVSQHRTQRGARGQPLALVGAPTDDNLQPGTSRSGAVWKCPISAQTEDCTQIPTDGLRSLNVANRTYGVYDGSLSRLNPPVASELKDGQWLGVEVRSQGEGGKVIVCAHRYTVRDVSKYTQQVVDSKRGMIGLCYVLGADLTLPRNDDIGSKNLMVVRDAVFGKRLEPKGVAFDDHAQWGVCQVGTAAAFVKKSDLHDADDADLALFGAPGCFTWRGNVFAQNVGTLRRYDVAVNHETEGDFERHGHMGLSVASGRFFDGQVFYASGAPHAGRGDSSRTGEVFFFQKETVNNRLKANRSLTLTGEAFGAGFGYSMAVLDANGDSSPDLLVGAPFLDGGKTGEGGAVFLYLSQKGSLDRESYVKIIGSRVESQFGLALTSLGDLNLDGFEDFAVGAPYEEPSGGAVYVFLGGQKGLRAYGASKEYLRAEDAADQIIRGSELASSIGKVPPSLSTFGSSLSGGMDMDGNGYPDLLVGAYNSNHVFLFRSRPIIDIETFVDESQLKGIDPGRKGCLDDLDSEEACFSFKTCFNVEKEVSERGLAIEFKIEAEPKKPVSRVWLRLKGGSSSTDTVKNTVLRETIRIVNGRRREHCTDVIGYVSSHADVQTPVQFALTYSLVQEEPRMDYDRAGAQLPDLNEFPILNQAQARKRFQATFERDCGEDEVCQSQLVLAPSLRNKQGVELGKTPGGFYEMELGSLEGSELVLDILVENLGEAAYEAKLDVHFPTAVNYIGLGAGAKLNTPELKNVTWLALDLGNPFKGADAAKKPNSARMQLRFSPRSDMAEKFIQFFVSVNTSSQQVYDASTFVNLVIVRRAEVRVLGVGFPEEVHYGGQVRGESAMRELAEIGPQVVHKFLVINNGPSDVDVLTVHISWPLQVENGKQQGKWLLYLTDHPLLRNGRGDCVLPFGHRANPLNLSLAGHDASRFTPVSIAQPVSEPKSAEENLFVASVSSSPQPFEPLAVTLQQRRKSKREVEQVIVPRVVKGASGDLRVLSLDCDKGSAKCLKITCQIYNLPAKAPATIEVRARLWNSTLVEDYADVDLVEVFAKAEVTVDPDITQDLSDDYVSVRTVAHPEKRQLSVESQLDWWIILVSILIGLLVLVLISLILWKLGFFKRKRPMEDDDADFMLSAHYEKVRLNGNSS